MSNTPGLQFEKLSAQHNVDSFSCADEDCTRWLKEEARGHQTRGFASVYVSADEQNAVAAYYALSAHGFTKKKLLGPERREATDPVPAILLGRMARNPDLTPRGYGKSNILPHLIERVARASELVAAAYLVTCPKVDGLISYYKGLGFTFQLKHKPLHLAMPMVDVVQTLSVWNQMRLASTSDLASHSDVKLT